MDALGEGGDDGRVAVGVDVERQGRGRDEESGARHSPGREGSTAEQGVGRRAEQCVGDDREEAEQGAAAEPVERGGEQCADGRPQHIGHGLARRHLPVPEGAQFRRGVLVPGLGQGVRDQRHPDPGHRIAVARRTVRGQRHEIGQGEGESGARAERPPEVGEHLVQPVSPPLGARGGPPQQVAQLAGQPEGVQDAVPHLVRREHGLGQVPRLHERQSDQRHRQRPRRPSPAARRLPVGAARTARRAG